MAELLKKITGDFPDEGSEALYRLAASRLSNTVRNRIKKRLNGRRNQEGREFVNGPIGKVLLSEPVFNFALASALELLLHGTALQDQRRLITYNLRVKAYEALGNEFLEWTGITALLEGDLVDALDHASKFAERREEGTRRGEPSPKGEAPREVADPAPALISKGS